MLATEKLREEVPALETAALRSEGMLLLLPRHPVGLILLAPGTAQDSPDLSSLLACFALSGLAVLLDEQSKPGQRTLALRSHRSLARAAALAGIIGAYELPLGLYGSGRAAARALHAAAAGSLYLSALVAFQGGADMADEGLDRIAAPTLFLSDGCDPLEHELNQAAADALCEHAEALAEPDPSRRWQVSTNWFLKYMAQA